jgi:hypothetical protein
MGRSRYDLKRIILYPDKRNENWGGENMVSIETAKSILNKNGKTYTDEEVKKIIELFKFWTDLEFNNYLKTKKLI